MTQVAIAHTDLTDSAAAGRTLGEQVRFSLGTSPDALVVFAAPIYDFTAFLSSLHAACSPVLLVGASSAGEFTSTVQGTNMACAVGICSTRMQFRAGLGRALSVDRDAVAESLVAAFSTAERTHPFRAALVLTDSLAGYAEDLVDKLSHLTGGDCPLFGGGAGGDENFGQRVVFFGKQAYADAAVALEILSTTNIGVGARHGWSQAGSTCRVTDAEGPQLKSLDAVVAAEIFEEHAQRTGQTFVRDAPLPFFLFNVLGVESVLGHKLRVPLAVNPDGSVACATEVFRNSTACIMRTSTAATAAAAAESARSALAQLSGAPPALAIVFDCVATRMRMGSEFQTELTAIQDALGDIPMVGCNTIGQIACVAGQFSGFHNCTAVVCVLPA